jgi:hypothetical protein
MTNEEKTMRVLLASLCLLAAVAPAAAANSMPHYNSTTMTCAEIQKRIHDEGAVVINFPSTANSSMPHYGRFVDSMHFCSANELMAPMSIPTADTKSCRVVQCVINR